MAAESPKRLQFARQQRIKQGRDFARLRQKGKRLVHGCMIANWLAASPGEPSRLGVVVSAKVGNSVRRSRVRRLLRESFRQHQHDLTEPIDLVLVARPSIAAKGFAEVEQDFLTTLRKAKLLVF
jgi:ribonuclease P protein component